MARSKTAATPRAGEGHDGADGHITAEALSLVALPPIPKEQLYEKISAAIMEQIRVGVLVPGQRLPPERALAGAFAVSRPSVREALGALQTLGVVETRHGSGSWIAGNALELVADRNDGTFNVGVSPLALLEARAAVEPVIAELAAQRFVPDPEINRLLKLMNKARDWGNPVHRATWSDGDRLYHQRLAVLTQNPVFVAAADFIASVQAQQLWRRLRDDTFAVPGRIARAVEEHERIFEAISNGRSDEAAQAARDHLDAVRDSMNLA